MYVITTGIVKIIEISKPYSDNGETKKGTNYKKRKYKESFPCRPKSTRASKKPKYLAHNE